MHVVFCYIIIIILFFLLILLPPSHIKTICTIETVYCIV